MDYSIIIYIIFGILPSLIWLSYYLRQDTLPEPRNMIIKIFLWGALITLPVCFIQFALRDLLDSSPLSFAIKTFTYWFLIIALSEELFKYLVVRIKVLGSYHLDEPVDIMLYMVIAALGFAAVENIFYLFAPAGLFSLAQILSRTIYLDFIRFIGATFLHTLCSATLGYWLIRSLRQRKNRGLLLTTGIFLATLLHGLYNFSIITLEGYLKFAMPAIIILTLAFLVVIWFDRAKKMKSICKI